MIGVLLAGGAGRRLERGGRGKAAVALAGRPLAAYPLDSLIAVSERVAVVCKPSTELPELDPVVERWDEPAEPRHPLVGMIHALERAGAPVLVCGADMPFVTADACRTLLMRAGGSGGAHAVVASAGGTTQPVFGVYSTTALESLRSEPPDVPLVEAVERLGPLRVALPPRLLSGVNTIEELAEAEQALSRA